MVTAVREFSLEHHLLDCLRHSGMDCENLADLVSIIVSLKNKYGIQPFTVAASIGPVPASVYRASHAAIRHAKQADEFAAGYSAPA